MGKPYIYHSVCPQSGLQELWLMRGGEILAGPARLPEGWVSLFNTAMLEELDKSLGISDVEWWKPGLALEEASCSWADWFDALLGRREAFARVEFEGRSMLCEMREAEAYRVAHFLNGGSMYRVTKVTMTRRQFEALPEFEGW